MDTVPRKFTKSNYEIVDVGYKPPPKEKPETELARQGRILEACLQSSTPVLNWLEDFTPTSREALSTLTLDTLQNARLLGETWILNERIVFDKNEAFGANDFYSNGQIFDQMSHYYRDGKHWLYYGTVLVNFNLFGWTQDNYRVISFTHKPCKVVLDWLEKNATKIQFWRERNDRKRTTSASSEQVQGV